MRLTVVLNSIREPAKPPRPLPLPIRRSVTLMPPHPLRSTSVQGRFFSAPPALLPGGVIARPGGPEQRCHSLGNFYKGREEITSPFLFFLFFIMHCAKALVLFSGATVCSLSAWQREEEVERGREREVYVWLLGVSRLSLLFFFPFLPVSLPELMMNYERAPAFPENTDVSALATS